MHTLQQLRSGELQGIARLTLACGLTEFPEEIFSLADSLEILDLSNNQLSSLPPDFGKLSKLKIAFFSNNNFTELPAVLTDCPQLDMIGFKSNRISNVAEQALPKTTRWLILTNNQIEALPESIGNCSRLQKVALAGNLLTALPDEMARCKNLELLRISANRFTALPQWLLRLPKVSWLAFAGNPFSKQETVYHLPQIDWEELELLEELGEGASGNIYKAIWHAANREAAVKVFKGDVTSDGFPDDELQTSIAAGAHPNRVALLGEIKNHPQQKQGLVMELIPPSFYNLGLPPSLASCSRDTFAEGTEFSAIEIFKIASGIASSTAQLHKKGITHGDLYAHNMLIDDTAHCLFGDFGAASFFDASSHSALALQRIETRAFGCLIDDLLQLLPARDKNKTLSKSLLQLRDHCMSEAVSERPVFTEIVAELEKMETGGFGNLSHRRQ